MRTEGQRQSEDFEDRGSGSGGGRAGGIPIQAVAAIVRLLGLKGTVIAAIVIFVGFLLMPTGLKLRILGAVTGGGEGAPSAAGASVCQASPANAAACDFSRVVLASTEDVWT